MSTLFKAVHRRLPGYDEFAFYGIIDAGADKLLADIPGKVTSTLVRCDFSGVGRINSMGIALLLRCFKRIRVERSAVIRISSLTPVNVMLFKMTGVLLLAELDGATRS